MEYWRPDRALVVAAHPDDIEYGCAGTVARWVQEGAHVAYCLVTNGAAGSSDPDMTRERLAALREAEARAAAKVVGVERVEFLGYEDGLLEPTLEVRERIVRVIRQVRPEVIVTSDPTTWYVADRYVNHPDHRAAGAATLAAVIPGADTRLAYPELLDEGARAGQADRRLAVHEPRTERRRGHRRVSRQETRRAWPATPPRSVTTSRRPPASSEVWADSRRPARPFEYGEAFKVLRFDLGWEAPKVAAEA